MGNVFLAFLANKSMSGFDKRNKGRISSFSQDMADVYGPSFRYIRH